MDENKQKINDLALEILLKGIAMKGIQTNDNAIRHDIEHAFKYAQMFFDKANSKH